jgi:hypothetical protein
MNKLKDIKNPGFKTSENYFSAFEDSVFQKLNAEIIKNVVDDHGFAMPKDYLTNIEEKVFNTIDASTDEVRVISIFSKRNLLYLSGVAAAVLIMISIFINNDNGNFDNLDVDLVENYIIDQDLSSYEIAALLTDEELLLVNDEIMDEAFADDSLESYLLENVNLEDIIEQ